MRGYDSSSYGDSFADVYDDWYADVSDVEATVATLRELGGTGPFLELGVGTGRIALALAASGARVTGIDSSSAMLERLGAKLADESQRDAGRMAKCLDWVHGDMVRDLPKGPFSVIFIAYNTFFSLGDVDVQNRLFAEVSSRLSPGGSFVVECAVPDVDRPSGATVGVRSLEADRVVLSIDVHDPTLQTVEGQFVELTESAGVRLRPWRIRYCTIEELDSMASAAGLHLTHRWESMRRDEYVADSPNHVSIYSR